MLVLLQVLDLDEESVVLKYMQPSGTYYVWPEVEDIYKEDLDSIICKLTAPALQNEREQYKFSEKDLKKAKSLV